MQTEAAFYKKLLLDHLSRKRALRQSYSLRAYARDLKIHPSALSRILGNKQELSLGSCADVIAALKLTGQRKIDFVESVLAERVNNNRAELYRRCGLTLTPLTSKPDRGPDPEI
ncbi:MAG: hypothetical protein EOP05_02285 [Proteobacteria bacterium]|nr:MAG: hypothetical protein EOP05_02285 [Pseudomonadota bacterium]